jgi:hypothetical protein
MKFKSILLADLVKTLFVIGVLSSLTLSTTLESLSLLSEDSYEIVNIDFQEDSEEDKEEKREVDDTKIKPQLLSYSQLHLSEKFNVLHSRVEFYSNSILEISIPPPELHLALS